MCNSACYHVFCHASSVDTQGDYLLAALITGITYRLNTKDNSLSSCQFESNWNLFGDSYNRPSGTGIQIDLSLQNQPLQNLNGDVQHCIVETYNVPTK